LGLDLGGLKREFFDCFFTEFFGLNGKLTLDMFVFNENKSFILFNTNSIENNIMFENAGILFALAIKNNIPIKIKFPKAYIKKL
jgi:hypothetical protein